MGRTIGVLAGVAWAAVFCMALTSVSCDGSDNSTASVANVRDACVVFCEKQSEAGCSGFTPGEQCRELCDAISDDWPCPDEYVAAANCAARKAEFSCTSSGDVVMRGCWTEMQPYLVCAACLPSAGDSACDTCEKTTCCAERKAYLGHPEFGALADCTSNCAEDAGSCLTACAARGQNLGAAVRAMLDCHDTCSGSCQ